MNSKLMTSKEIMYFPYIEMYKKKIQLTIYIEDSKSTSL